MKVSFVRPILQNTNNFSYRFHLMQLAPYSYEQIRTIQEELEKLFKSVIFEEEPFDVYFKFTDKADEAAFQLYLDREIEL